MFYIVGLGNPGSEYEYTRHNVGFLALDFVLKSHQLPEPREQGHFLGRHTEGKVEGVPVAALFPETFMNHSGNAVKKLVLKEEVHKLIVLYDDVALPFGVVKVAFDRGDGGHNGLKSIISSLGSKEFVRVRIGVGPVSFWTGKPKTLTGEDLAKFVLAKFTSRERTRLETEILKQVKEAVSTIIKEGYVKAMNTFN